VGRPVATGLTLGEGVPDGVACDEVGLGGRGLLGADLDDLLDRLLGHVAGEDLAGVQLAVHVAQLVGDAARAGLAGLDDLGLAVGHRAVVATYGAEGDLFAADLLALDLDLGDGDLVAGLDLGVQLRRDLVVVVVLDVHLVERVGHGESRNLDLLSLVATDRDLDGLRGDDLELEAVTTDRGRAAGRQVGAGEAATDLGEGAVHVSGGDPVLGGLAVDGEVEGTREGDRDGRAVVDGAVEGRGDDVVLADVDAFGHEDLFDGVTHGADFAGLPVQGQ